MYKIRRYFSGVLKQAKMVRWPNKSDMVTSFAVVIVIIAISAVALTIDNYVISKILQTLEDQFGVVEEAASAIRYLF